MAVTDKINVEKKCTKCLKSKKLTEFSKKSDTKDGLMSHCKLCRKAKAKLYYQKNKKQIINKSSKYYEHNKDVIKEKHEKYRKENKTKRKIKDKERYKNNREKIIKRVVEYTRNKRETDPVCSLKNSITALIHYALKNKNFKKTTRTHSILGCSYEEFKVHLEDNKYNLKITDKDVDIDHIIPISSAQTEEEVLKLNHYTNFQLLPSEYNRHMKKAKTWDKVHFESWLESSKSIKINKDGSNR